MIILRKSIVIPIFFLLIQCYLVKNQDINYEDYRLNNEVIPVNYRISLDLSKKFSTDTNYDGTVSIDVAFKNPISAPTTKTPIKLNVKDITVLKEKVQIYETADPSKNINPDIKINSTVEMLILTFGDDATPLDTGKKYTIQISYSGKLHDDMYGLYRSEYKDENDETQ